MPSRDLHPAQRAFHGGARSIESVFQQCLKLATEVLASRAAHFDHVVDDALHSAELRFHAPAGASAGKGEHSFGRTLCHQFRTKVSAQFAQLLSEEAARRTPRPAAKTSLDLVSVEEAELQAQKSSLASSIAAAVEQDLLLLNRNLAALVGCEEIAEARSPFAPVVLIEAAVAALAARGLEGSLATALLRPIAAEATRPLKLMYGAMNAMFGDEPPLHRPRQRADGPAVSHTARMQRTDGARDGARDSAAAFTGVEVSALPASPPGDPYLIDMLVNLLAAGWRVGAPSALLPGAPLPLLMVPGGVLARAQADDGDYRDAQDQARLAGSLAGLSALSEAAQPGQDYAEELKLFTQWRAGIRDLLLDVPRRVAFDLVASLFDGMCRCDLVPVTFRQRMLGVQSSLLATAIRNPSAYFLTHRTLVQALERLATSSVGTVTPNDTLALAWDDALDLLLQFAEEPAAYKPLLQEVVQRAEEFASRVEHMDTSRRATAARQAMGWMRRAVPRAAKDSFLREFLLWTWSRVLARALNDMRLGHTLTPKYLKAARTAVWSVQPSRNDEQRANLKRAIPDLVRTFKDGMRLIKLDNASELAFLSRLMEGHRRALGLGADAPPVDRSASAPRNDGETLTFDELREGEHYLLRAGTGLLRLQLQARGSAERPTLFVGENGLRPLLLSADSITLLLRDGTLRRCTAAANEAPAPGERLDAREEAATARLRALLTQARG
jgi:hypothetical protein